MLRQCGRPAGVRKRERHVPVGWRPLVGSGPGAVEQPARVHRREPPAVVRERRPA